MFTDLHNRNKKEVIIWLVLHIRYHQHTSLITECLVFFFMLDWRTITETPYHESIRSSMFWLMPNSNHTSDTYLPQDGKLCFVFNSYMHKMNLLSLTSF